jgi:cytoskeletal protein CcmA (bactofilin family)
MFGNREKEDMAQPAPPKEKERTQRAESVIHEGVSFNGTLKVDGSLTINGQFEGAINCTGRLVVGKTGRVKADLDVGSTTIAGRVEGKVIAKERVELETASFLKGDVHAKSFVIQDGCFFQGNCTMGEASKHAPRPATSSEKTKPEMGMLKQA